MTARLSVQSVFSTPAFVNPHQWLQMIASPPPDNHHSGFGHCHSSRESCHKCTTGGCWNCFSKKIPTPCHNELTKNGSLPGRQQVQNPICGWSNPFSAGLYPHTYLLFKSQFSFFTVNVNFDQFWIILAAFIPISPAEILVVQIPNFLGVFIPKCVCAPSFCPNCCSLNPPISVAYPPVN